MDIQTTNIPDVIPENINESKIVLANKLINNVYPLLDEIYSNKIDQVKELEKELELKKSLVLEKKKCLESLSEQYKKKKDRKVTPEGR